MEMKKNMMGLDMTELSMYGHLKRPLVERDTPVAIIGTGDYARALSKRLAKAGKKVLCGSRYPGSRNITGRDPEIASLDVTVVAIARAIQEADVIFLALHTDHIEQTLKNYVPLLSGKVLVDISNPDHTTKYFSHAERLAKRYANAHVVKAFNTISAYALENNLDEGDKRVYIASDSKEANEAVADLAQAIGLETVTYSNLQEAAKLENMQKSLFRGWGTALIIAGVIFMAWAVYGTYRYHIKKGHAWSRWPVNTMNKVYACTALTLLPLCFMPGVIASVVQLVQGSKHKVFPGWLDRWMRSRKQLGLLALWLAGVHCIMSVAHLSPAYFKKWFDIQEVVIPMNQTEDLHIPIDVRLNWKGETAICLGTLALATMSILGITSLPSVGSRLNWRQWRFVQSYLGFFCLMLATAHTTMKGAPYWTSKPFGDTAIGMSFLSLVIPYITMASRILLLLPFFSIPLSKIRRGWECCASKSKKDPIHKCSSCAMIVDDEHAVRTTTTNLSIIPAGVQNMAYESGSPGDGRKASCAGVNTRSVDGNVDSGDDVSTKSKGRDGGACANPQTTTSKVVNDEDKEYHPNYESIHLP